MADLNPRQQRFVDEYLIDLNATQAAVRAGYSKKTAEQIGSRLLRNVKVAKAVAKAQAKRAERTGVTADRVLQELAVIGFSDIRHLVMNEFGKLELAEKAPDHAMRAVASVKYRSRTDEDGNSTNEAEYRLWDKNTALANMGRHLGMFADGAGIPVGGGLTIRVVHE